jgi:hypothetical protein
MLKFKRGHIGDKVSYEIYDGTNTAVIYLNPGNMTLSWNNHRDKVKLRKNIKEDIPAMMQCIAACGLDVTPSDYETIRDLVNDAADISAIKVAEMY